MDLESDDTETDQVRSPQALQTHGQHGARVLQSRQAIYRTKTRGTLLAGTSEPRLDVFFQTSKLTRFEIVATKAFTPTISHLEKIAYFQWLTISLSKPLHELAGLLYVIAFLLTSHF